MRIPRWNRKRGAPTLVLLYHRVADLSSDPQLLAVSPAHFSEHLEVLRESFRPIPLSRLTDGLHENADGLPNVAVTFDDGYADNLYEARPRLERADVPATVFVATGRVDAVREFWWDELEGLLLHDRALPPRLQLRLGGRQCEWVVAGDGSHDRSWNVTQRGTTTDRQSLYLALCDHFRPLAEDAQEDLLEALRDWAGLPALTRDTHRTLAPEEVARLVTPLIDVGSHTVSHPVLSALPAAAQEAEILRSKHRLQGLIGREVSCFAYPYGSRADYTTTTMTIVRDSGFRLACANVPEAVLNGTDRLQLPRFLIRDWNGDEFARHLRTWLTTA